MSRQIEHIEIEALLETLTSDTLWRIESRGSTTLIYHSSYSTISNGKAILLQEIPEIVPEAIARVVQQLAEDIALYLSPFVDDIISYLDYQTGYFVTAK